MRLSVNPHVSNSPWRQHKESERESTNQSAAFSISETVLRNDQSEPAEGDRAPTNRLPVKSSDLFQFIQI